MESERRDEEREAVAHVLLGHEAEPQELDERAERRADHPLVRVAQRVLEQRAHRVEAVPADSAHDQRQRAAELLAKAPRCIAYCISFHITLLYASLRTAVIDNARYE